MIEIILITTNLIVLVFSIGKAYQKLCSLEKTVDTLAKRIETIEKFIFNILERRIK